MSLSEKRKATQRAYRQRPEVKERRRKQQRNYYYQRKTDLTSLLRNMLKDARIRARARGMVCSLTLSQLKRKYQRQNGKCYLSGRVLELNRGSKSVNKISLDRKNSNRGYTPKNTHLVTIGMNLGYLDFNREEIDALWQDRLNFKARKNGK